MTTTVLRDVLEATGYLAGGEPAHGVLLDDEARRGCRTRRFAPDALWRSDAAVTVHFKYEPDVPADDRVAAWRREVWNQGFAPLLWVVSPERIDLYNGFGRPRASGDADAHRLRTFRTVEHALDELDAFAGRLAMETGRFWQAGAVDRRSSVDRQLLSDLAALERDLVAAGLDRAAAQGLIGRSIFTQYLIDRGIVTADRLESDYGHGGLSAVLRDHAATERLFGWLRNTFNGDVFPPDDIFVPGAEHLGRVADFLDDVDPVSGQRKGPLQEVLEWIGRRLRVRLATALSGQRAFAGPRAPRGRRRQAGRPPALDGDSGPRRRRRGRRRELLGT